MSGRDQDRVETLSLSPEVAVGEADPGDDPRVGQMAGNYRLRRLIGKGGMGEVYLASHPKLGLEVAVKLLPKTSLGSRAASRFLTEARAATQIDHHGIIRIFDFGQLQDGTLYYAMEALEGQGLDKLIASEGPWSVVEALAFLEEVVPILQAAHAQGVVHRDLKPSNIFVTSREPLRLKLLDFGVAKLLAESDAVSAPEAEGVGHGVAPVTLLGEALTGSCVVGTPSYMAPEQADGDSRGVGPATDIYALGVTLYQLLSGELPIVAGDTETLLERQLRATPEALDVHRPELGADVVALVHRCLAKDPEDRPAEVGEVLTAFRAAAGLAAVTPQRAGVVALVGVVLAMVVAAAILASRGDGAEGEGGRGEALDAWAPPTSVSEVPASPPASRVPRPGRGERDEPKAPPVKSPTRSASRAVWKATPRRPRRERPRRPRRALSASPSQDTPSAPAKGVSASAPTSPPSAPTSRPGSPPGSAPKSTIFQDL